MARHPTDEPDSAEWAATRERGSPLALRILIGIVRTLGHRALAPLIVPISLYFVCFAGDARRASLDYQRRVRRAQGVDGDPGLLDVYRHVHAFAVAIRDRIALWSGAMDDFDIHLHGAEHMQPLIDARKGAMLVGAHIGSFDVLRVIARDADIPVNVVMYTLNAEHINAAFQELDPGSNVRLLHMNPSSMSTSLEIKRCIERGEFVAVLGDRIVSSGRHRVGRAKILGDEARFPQGPFLLASMLGVPLLLTVALRRSARVYDIHLETLHDGSPVDLKSRAAVVQDVLTRYAARLEHYCLRAPLQWFNFYDFWSEA